MATNTQNTQATPVNPPVNIPGARPMNPFEQLQYEMLLEQRARQEEEKQQFLRVKEETARQLMEEHRKLVDTQSKCSHMKPNGAHATVAMKDSSRRTILMCQNCTKLGSQKDFPAHLHVPDAEVGGPS